MTDPTTLAPLLTEGSPILEEIARERALLIFDFDGTLAPIVDRRTEARMRPETWALLRATALLYPCAVISGRARPDVAARLAGLPLVAIVGNHGAERGWGPIDRHLERQAHEWAETLRTALADIPGVDIELKQLGLAVHFRQARDHAAAEARIHQEVDRLEHARFFGGHCVVNVLREDAPHKGDALRALKERMDARLVVYVGDDRTDEDAFQYDEVISIRVGAERPTRAQYRLPTQAQVDDLLRALVAARARLDGLGERRDGFVRVVAR